ncbi:J domain-containing protein [Altererythrobacter sp. MF3-039]|uniref:J domain-containing protein n=1 Tax=Altererythrobacter sp. MF3-039 TaxID=3252901 RepID=UPI00390C53D5
MSGARRSLDWGFPRWRAYGGSREATNVRLCDRHGCEEKGDCPAPKAPNSPEKWFFCQKHAAEYNSKWDYFEGLDKAEAAERAKAERSENAGYAEAAHYGWAGAGDGSRSADEMRALELLELEADADFPAVKKAWREKAKLVHPDVKPGDSEAAKRFQAYQVAYDVLRQAEERRSWKG